MIRRWGCVLLVAYPIVEIVIAVLVAQVIGWWWLLVAVVTCIVLGLGLVRYALGATGRSFGVAIATLQGPGETGLVAIEGTDSASAARKPSLMDSTATSTATTPPIPTTATAAVPSRCGLNPRKTRLEPIHRLARKNRL